MNKPKKRWDTEKQILAAINRRILLIDKNNMLGNKCMKDMAKSFLTRSDLAARHFKISQKASGQLKTLKNKLAECMTVPLFPEVMGDGGVQR